jgi:hypothetical protein
MRRNVELVSDLKTMLVAAAAAKAMQTTER